MKKRILAILMTLVLLLPIMAGTVVEANAAQVVDLKVQGTYDYTKAYQILAKVNKERAAKGLSALKMDEKLLKYAMKRAAESRIYFSHTRPDGTSCFSIMPKSYRSGCGENIAVGQDTVSGVMYSWMHSDEHRANILNSKFKSIGIGCFYQEDGQPTWVQLFSYASPTKVTKSGQAKVAPVIKASTDNLDLHAISCQVYKGSSKTLKVENYNKLETVIQPVWTSVKTKNTSVATVSKGVATGKAVGKTTVACKLGSLKINIPVTVKAR